MHFLIGVALWIVALLLTFILILHESRRGTDGR